MNVILYSGFTKRVNSTARPSNATARTFDCVLKQGTSMIAPTIILDVGLETAPTAYTYAYIPDFNRYYWVRDWVNVHPVWHCSLTCDVLASGRSEILAYNAYVLRSSGAEYEGQLNDATCVTFTDPQIQIANIPLFAAAPADYTYVVGIVADSTQSVALSGTTTYYVLTQAEMNAFRAFLLNDFDRIVLPAPAFCLLVAITCTLVHAFGDCPLRSPAVLTLFFVTLAAMPGFLPEKGY